MIQNRGIQFKDQRWIFNSLTWLELAGSVISRFWQSGIVILDLKCIHMWHQVSHPVRVIQGKHLSMMYFVRLLVYVYRFVYNVRVNCTCICVSAIHCGNRCTKQVYWHLSCYCVIFVFVFVCLLLFLAVLLFFYFFLLYFFAKHIVVGRLIVQHTSTTITCSHSFILHSVYKK